MHWSCYANNIIDKKIQIIPWAARPRACAPNFTVYHIEQHLSIENVVKIKIYFFPKTLDKKTPIVVYLIQLREGNKLNSKERGKEYEDLHRVQQREQRLVQH